MWDPFNNSPHTTPGLIDQIADENRRAKRVKAVESYAESASQMILQVYILCKRMCSETQEHSDGKYSLANVIVDFSYSFFTMR